MSSSIIPTSVVSGEPRASNMHPIIWSVSFAVAAIITALVFTRLKPKFVQKSDGTVDRAKLAIYSVVVGIFGLGFAVFLTSRVKF